jgi:hypothetical protein
VQSYNEVLNPARKMAFFCVFQAILPVVDNLMAVFYIITIIFENKFVTL